MDCKLDIPLHGPSLSIVRRCGPALIDVLQSKFGCVAVINDVDFEGNRSFTQWKRPVIVPEKRYSVNLPFGVEVSVWKADLTNFQVDAVVNAANIHLQHGGGLALALSEVGGPQIQRESDAHINSHGPLTTGDAIVTGAGTLPCKKIIHAVGPQLPRSPSRSEVSTAEGLLTKAIISILDRMKENHLQSVAIPAISSGIFNYPLPHCADAIVAAVKHYLKSTPGHLLKEIRLANHDEPSVCEMERALRQQFPINQSMSYSQAATSQSKKHQSKISACTVQMGKVQLTLIRGKIEEQMTDVIVNTASGDRNLKIGEISKALLHKSGYRMQEELSKSRRDGLVIPTDSYRLRCKNVYHTFCPGRGNENAVQILFESVTECLKMAESTGQQSISFPAIGTGNLGFAKRETAEVMSNAVASFAQKCSNNLEIYFVIYPSDNDTFKAFEEKMRILQEKASHFNFTTAPEHKGDLHESKARRPQISLRSSSDAATREADYWLQGLFSKSTGTVTIHNNFILHLGEQVHQQLSHLTRNGVSIEESFMGGRAGITVFGSSNEDVIVAGLQVEALLCKIQNEFVREEECAMLQMSNENLSFERILLKQTSQDFGARLPLFTQTGLRMIRLEKVENPTLRQLFDLKKTQLKCTNPQTMFQRIPAQFREMVSHIGFHTECAPPEDPKYGEGIYFTTTVKKALEVWKEPSEKYAHFVEAEVLTGNSCPGNPGLILPPAVGKDPEIVYNSLSGGPDMSVVFSGYQALPKYIITCMVI